MLITQRTFLHRPTRDLQTIQTFINERRVEDEMLEFKVVPWEKGKGIEAAKDIAAFANHFGGDIILGIEAGDDFARGWNPIPDEAIPVVENQIRQALISFIRPSELAELVEITPVKSNKPGHSVITVSVPPFHQLVGVEQRNSDHTLLQFPVRIGNRTRFIAFDEAMARLTFTTRATFVKLKSLVDQWKGLGIAISFSSPIYIYAATLRVPNEFARIPLPLEQGMHAMFDELTSDTLTVKLQNLSLLNENMNYGNTPFAYHITIPLEFVRAAWIDPKKRTLEPGLSLALDADIVWDGATWGLVTNPTR